MGREEGGGARDGRERVWGRGPGAKGEEEGRKASKGGVIPGDNTVIGFWDCFRMHC